MKLYFVRHGESEANTRRIISNREQSLRLTERGRGQANALADRLRSIPITSIFCSPVLRARETADIVSAALGIPYQVTQALREYDCGILEDRSDEASWRLHRYYFDDWTLNHNYTNKPEGGESFVDIQNRFVPFIESMKNTSDQQLLLIGHGGLFLLMLPLLLLNINNEFVQKHAIGHTDCIVAELQPNGFVCKQWGDLQF